MIKYFIPVDTAVSPAATAETGPEPVAKTELPLPEKIKSIVRSHPEYGAFKIKRELNTVEYGFTKVSWFNVRGELGTLGHHGWPVNKRRGAK